MSSKYGVPASPTPSFVEVNPEDEDECMREQPVPVEMMDEDEHSAHQDSEKEDDYHPPSDEDEEAGDESARPQRASGPDMSKPWHPRQHRQAAAPPRRAAADDSSDGLDDRVERVHAGSSMAGDEDDRDADPPSASSSAYVDARSMPDYRPEDFGFGRTAKIPEFRHGVSGSSTWISYLNALREVQHMRPSRTASWIVPIELFARCGTRFRHWTTPHANPMRASAIASVVSFCFASMSKGFLCTLKL